MAFKTALSTSEAFLSLKKQAAAAKRLQEAQDAKAKAREAVLDARVS